jgi:signal peptidase I
MFRTTYLKAILAWLPTLVAAGIMLAFVFLIIKPFVVEAFVVSNNSMAPTLLGPHYVGNCPQCAQLCVFDASRLLVPGEEMPGICPHCFESVQTVRTTTTEPEPADRFICSKVLSLRRWDAVVFRSLEDPSQKYVKRLIGLPGEEIVLKEGGVWVNGALQSAPPEIAPLYSHLDFALGTGKWGSEDDPARLGPDEYFVLGDFALQSRDSRLWHQGLPKRNIEAVVSLIYWPPSRWRILR